MPFKAAMLIAPRAKPASGAGSRAGGLSGTTQDDCGATRTVPGHPEQVVWSNDDGYRCAVKPYDETRYQLRLAWRDETVRSDLFESYDHALAAASEWKSAVEITGRTNP